jgi:hypothetical protein
MPEFDRLLLFRALRPDRLTAAMRKFVTNMIGTKYVTSQPYDLERSFQDSSPGTPIFVFLSPGVDVVSHQRAASVGCHTSVTGGCILCSRVPSMWHVSAEQGGQHGGASCWLQAVMILKLQNGSSALCCNTLLLDHVRAGCFG